MIPCVPSYPPFGNCPRNRIKLSKDLSPEARNILAEADATQQRLLREHRARQQATLHKRAVAALAAQAEAHAQEKTVQDAERARLATERQAYDEWASRVIAEAGLFWAGLLGAILALLTALYYIVRFIKWAWLND